jgi:hypothetical protein
MITNSQSSIYTQNSIQNVSVQTSLKTSSVKFSLGLFAASTLLVASTTAFAENLTQASDANSAVSNPEAGANSNSPVGDRGAQRDQLQSLITAIQKNTIVPLETLQALAQRYVEVIAGTSEADKPKIRTLLVDIDGAGQTHLVKTLAEIHKASFYIIDLGRYASDSSDGHAILDEIAGIVSKHPKAYILFQSPEAASASVQHQLASVLKTGVVRRSVVTGGVSSIETRDCKELSMFFVNNPKVEIIPGKMGGMGFLADVTPKSADQMSLKVDIANDLLAQMTDIISVPVLNEKEFGFEAIRQVTELVKQLNTNGLSLDLNSFQQYAIIFSKQAFMPGTSRAEIAGFIRSIRSQIAKLSLRIGADSTEVYVVGQRNGQLTIGAKSAQEHRAAVSAQAAALEATKAQALAAIPQTENVQTPAKEIKSVSQPTNQIVKNTKPAMSVTAVGPLSCNRIFTSR